MSLGSLTCTLERCTRNYPEFNTWADPKNKLRAWAVPNSDRIDRTWYGLKSDYDSVSRTKSENGIIYADSRERSFAYPMLNRFKFLSLGSDGSYYARGTRHRWNKQQQPSVPVSFSLPKSLTEDIPTMEKLPDEYTKVWLGRDGAWVVMNHRFGFLKFNLNDPNGVGLYPGLHELLDRHATGVKRIHTAGWASEGESLMRPPKLMALTLDNNSSNWAAVFGYHMDTDSPVNWALHSHGGQECKEFCTHFYYYRSGELPIFEQLEKQWNELYQDRNPMWQWVDVKSLGDDLTY